jgi:cell division inhibitor SepF
MAFRDTWHRTLVYFGLAEEEEYDEEYDADSEPEVQMQESYRDRPSVRRLGNRPRRSHDDFDEIFGDEESEPRRTTTLRAVSGRSGGGGGGGAAGGGASRGSADVRVHFVAPKSFNDAQEVADRFKDGIPVILNLQGAGPDLSRRLIDFASGLTYALDGGVQRIADKVFMLTPQNVEVSAEERARLIEKGFFNQS